VTLIRRIGFLLFFFNPPFPSFLLLFFYSFSTLIHLQFLFCWYKGLQQLWDLKLHKNLPTTLCATDIPIAASTFIHIQCSSTPILSIAHIGSEQTLSTLEIMTEQT
jgi:hypothetical protein